MAADPPVRLNHPLESLPPHNCKNTLLKPDTLSLLELISWSIDDFDVLQRVPRSALETRRGARHWEDHGKLPSYGESLSPGSRHA